MLNEFIPYAVAQGYQLVTMNEMFGYEPNSHEPLDGAIDAMTAEIPALQPYEVVPVEYKKPSYAWGVKLIQDRLYELGYLSSAGDGAFGGKTEKDIKAFQSRAWPISRRSRPCSRTTRPGRSAKKTNKEGARPAMSGGCAP